MKTFHQLTQTEKEMAISHSFNAVLDGVIQGHIAIENENVKREILLAIDDMDRMMTPWFYKEAIRDAEYKDGDGEKRNVGQYLKERFAVPGAMARLYLEDHESAIHISRLHQ